MFYTLTLRALEPLEAVPRVIGKGAPYYELTWVECAENNAVLKKIE